jgi:superfamily II DNA or RNA helicase
MQRKALLLTSTYCAYCGQPLDHMHADHIIPYSKNGQTTMSNAQALCAKCNIIKSNKAMEKQLKLRPWQRTATDRLLEVYKEGKREFLCVACVGAGKTIFAGYIFNGFKSKNIYDSVVVISPSDNIKRNWAKTIELAFKVKIDHSYSFKHAWPRDCHGISITYQSLNIPNVELLSRYVNERTLLIVDEVHHAGDNRAWGDAIRQIGDLAGFRLLLSGTPDRKDNSPIPFVTYKYIKEKEKYKLESNFSYNFAQAVDDGQVCPVIFQRNKAFIKTFTGGDAILDSDQLDEDHQRRLFNQILTVPKRSEGEKPSWVMQTFDIANEKLNDLNDLRNENYAGLVVCKSIEDAENLYEQIYEKYGADFVEIVTSKQEGGDLPSSQKIERFNTSKQSWIISINMISEGVDIPRIRTILYASHVTTKVRFIQVMGRGVRSPRHLPNNSDVCYFYMPDYPPLIDNASGIERELAHVYERLEKEDEERKKRDTGLGQFSIDDILMESESIGAGNVFDGDLWSAQEDVLATTWSKEQEVSKDKVLTLWKLFKEEMGQANDVVEEKPYQFRTSTEEKELLRRKIHNLVAKISYQIDGQKPGPETIKLVHWELNQRCGIKLSNTATLDELRCKIKAGEKWYLTLSRS